MKALIGFDKKKRIFVFCIIFFVAAVLVTGTVVLANYISESSDLKVVSSSSCYFSSNYMTETGQRNVIYVQEEDYENGKDLILDFSNQIDSLRISDVGYDVSVTINSDISTISGSLNRSSFSLDGQSSDEFSVTLNISATDLAEVTSETSKVLELSATANSDVYEDIVIYGTFIFVQQGSGVYGGNIMTAWEDTFPVSDNAKVFVITVPLSNELSESTTNVSITWPYGFVPDLTNELIKNSTNFSAATENANGIATLSLNVGSQYNIVFFGDAEQNASSVSVSEVSEE